MVVPTTKLRTLVSTSVSPSSHASVMGCCGKKCFHSFFTSISGDFMEVDQALRTHSHRPMVVRKRIVAVGLCETHFFCTPTRSKLTTLYATLV